MASHRFASREILALLGSAMLLRLLLAYVMLQGSGHLLDIRMYSQWGLTLQSSGSGVFYSLTDSDYPPGYLYILWLVGTVSHAISSFLGADVQKVMNSLIKVPPMVLDMGVGLLLYRIVRRLCTEDAVAKRAALTAAAIYLFNPVSLYDSAIWGQSDAAGAFMALLAASALFWWPPEVAGGIAVAAAVVKPQFGVILVPLMGSVLLRRHILQPIGVSGHLRASYLFGRNGPIRMLTSIVVGTLLLDALVHPFNLNLRTFIERMIATAQNYDIISVNAFNPWALVGSGATRALVFGGVDTWSADDVPLFGSVTGVMIGGTLLAVGNILGMARLLWRCDRQSIVLVGAYLSLCFFILPTRVHERYLFPVFAFTSLLAVFDRRWLWANVLLAIGSLMNLHGVLSFYATKSIASSNIGQLPFGTFLRSPTGILVSIALQTGVFIFAAWCLRPVMLRPRIEPVTCSGEPMNQYPSIFISGGTPPARKIEVKEVHR